MNQNIEFKAIPGQFNIDEAQGIVECFVAGIGNKDSVGDVLVSGAFTKSLTRRKPRVVWGHNWNDPIGKVLEIYEVAPGDRRLPMKMLNAGIGGLYARVQFNLSSEKGREAFANVAFFGQEQEWSIGYKTLDSIFDPNLQANILKEVELYEVSPVLHGANQLTGTISVKSDETAVMDEAKGGMMMAGPMAGRPTGMMPHRHHMNTPNILEANKPRIGDERKNQLEIELSVRAGAPVKVRVAEENTVIFDRMTPDGAPVTYRVAYHYTGREFMFGKPEKVSVQTVYVPSSDESGSRVVIPSQMPSMPMQVKPQGNAYLGDDQGEVGMIMPKSYDGEEKWSFDEDFADLANIISDSVDVKVGRALSAKNMSRLKAILENLQQVIASAEKEVQEKTDYVIPVPLEKAFETKQLLDPIFDYHRVESHVTEDGIIVTSGVTNEFIEAIGVAEKALGRTLSGGLGKLGSAARGAARFDPNAWDGDGDGVVQEGTPFKRPAIPGVNDRSTGGRVNAAAATRAFQQQGGLASASWEKPRAEKDDLGFFVLDSQILTDRMNGMSLADAAKKYNIPIEKVRQREAREQDRLRKFSSAEDILAYRMLGMSPENTAKLVDKPRDEVKKMAQEALKKLKDDKDGTNLLEYRERGLSLEQVSKLTGIKPAELRKREQIAINNRPEIPEKDKPLSDVQLAQMARDYEKKPKARGLASRGRPEPLKREGEFFGSPVYDEFNGQYVNGEVIALSDLYGDDRPGYAVVGIYDTDGNGTVGYFYGGDDEEFETIEDAMDFFENIEKEGENDRFYDDPGFRKLDRARSAGRPGERPLSGLASTSEIATRDREVLKGEIVSGPGAVTPASKQVDSMVNRGLIKDTHGDLLNEILSDLTPENMESEDAGKILSNIRKQLLQSIKDGKFDDFRDAKISETTLRDYLEYNVIETVLDSLFETMNETGDIKFADNKARRKVAEELRDELIDEWGQSLKSSTKKVRQNKPPTEDEIKQAKKRAGEKLYDLIEELEDGSTKRDVEEFWYMVDDIIRLDPSRDSAEMIIDLERAAKSGKDTNPDNENVVGIFDELDGYEANPQKLKDFIRNELDDAKLNSDFLPERVRAKERLSGGLASRSVSSMDDEELINYGVFDYPGLIGINATNALRQDDSAIDELVEKFDDIIETVKNNENASPESADILSRISKLKDKEKIKSEIKKILENNRYGKTTDEHYAIAEAIDAWAYSVAENKNGYSKDGNLYKIVKDAAEEGAIELERDNRGGLASSSRRGEGSMLGRAGQIARDDRGNVDPTEARQRRAEFDQNIFKKLRDMGFSDDEIEQLTGVPDGGRIGEGGKPAQYVPDDIGRGGLASQSRVPGKLTSDSFLQRVNRATSEDGTTVLDNQILKDFLSGMSAKEINEKYKLGGERFAKSAANREFRRLSRNSESQANSDMDLLMYRASGLSVRDAADVFGISPREVRRRERRLQSKLKKNIDDEDLLYLRSGLTLEEAGKLLNMEPAKLRQRELKARKGNGSGRQARVGLASYSRDDEMYDEAYGPNAPRVRRGMPADEIGDAVAESVDMDREIEDRTGIPRRSGLASQSRQMDMTLDEYGKLQSVLEKYVDDSQVGGVGSDEDMEILQDIIDKIDNSVLANDAMEMSDSEIDSYIDTLTRMNDMGPVEGDGDKKAITELIDSLKKTKKAKDRYYGSDALEQAGTRLSSPARKGKKVRPFSSQSGTINPHKKLEIELTSDEIGTLRSEVESLSATAEDKNIFKNIADKLQKANNGKLSISDSEYEDLVKGIEQSKSRSGAVSSDLLGVLEQAAESSDGKFSSLNLRSGGLASSNGGKRPNNGAPEDITEAMQKEYIFWAKSANARNLRLVQEALAEYNKNDGQLPPSMWKRLRTMYENLAPGSGRGGRRGVVGRGDGSGRRARVGLASASEGGYEGRSTRPGIPPAMRPADFEVRGEDAGGGKGSAMGAEKNEKFTGLSLDEAKPDNWDELTNDEKFEWLMYEGNPEKVADKNQRMSKAAHEGAIKKVLQDMEREERRSMTPEERRAERDAMREERRRDLSEAEAERQAAARKKREQAALKEQGPKKTYKPKKDAKEAKIDRQDTLQDYQDIITDTQRKLEQALEKAIEDGENENDFNPSAEDIWETVYALLGDEDMTKKSINDAIEALNEYIESNSPGENTYEKLSIKQAKGLLGKLSKTQDKYSNDPWIVDDLPRAGGLASRSKDGDRPRPGSREMPQSNAKRENEMKKLIDLAQQVLDDMRSNQDSNKGRRARVGLASTSAPKAMITDEATFFKDIESSLQKEIRAAQKAGKQDAVKGLTKLQEVIRRNEASKTGSRRTNVGSIYLTDTEADMVLEGLMFALDNQIEIGGDKRIEWYSKLLDKVSQAAMSTFINKNF